jgi:Zn-dependent peptidase ImmA (M78 family)/transcriptional regulator with XRE-family HTH domain
VTDLGEVLTTIRRARGLTQEEVAIAAGVTQAALSRYENGMREPEGEVLDRLATTLGVTRGFLAHAGQYRGGMAVDAHMRRRQTAKATVWRQIEARLNTYRMHASLLFEEVSLHSDQHVPTFDPIDVLPVTAARLVRMQWRLPIGPVRSLIRWMEAAGCLVVEEDFGTSRVDGMSQWVEDHPVILLNSRMPTDRKRLTAAHELGHLVLHSHEVTETLEQEANAFAAEFLMPIEVIRPQLRNLKLARLPDLKRQWGVSMQALIEHGYGAGLVTARERTSLYKVFSAKGWRTHEPASDELPQESPSLASTIGRTLSERGLTPDDIAHLAGFARSEDNEIFNPPGPRLRALQ